jgi:hypothetical protein
VTPLSFAAGCAAALALLLVVCAGIPAALVWVFADPAHVPGGQEIGPEVGMRGLGLGPVAPCDHAGGPRTAAERDVADLVRGVHADMRMKREVEFVAWGPHDPKGETVNVRKRDDYAVFRVRYRYQYEGQPLVERDLLYTLERRELLRVGGEEGPARYAYQPPLLSWGSGCCRDNPDGGAWLQKALAAKRAREAR